MKFPYLGVGLSVVLAVAMSNDIAFAGQFSNVSYQHGQVASDSLKVENLATALKKLKPIAPEAFKAKLKKEINGFKLTEAEAFEDAETGSFANANYVKGSQNIYLMITDGAGPGSEQVKGNLLNYLALKEFEEPENKSKIKNYKGWPVLFDWSMFENDGLTTIQYVEGGRYAVISSANNVPIEELEQFLNGFSL